MLKRRDFLKGLLLAAPASAVLTSDVWASKPLPYQFMPGDLVNGTVFIGARVVVWADPSGKVGVSNGCYGQAKSVDTLRVDQVSLFEGLPGNRVDNPSMRHRLIRDPGTIGLRYPEDASRIKPAA